MDAKTLEEATYTINKMWARECFNEDLEERKLFKDCLTTSQLAISFVLNNGYVDELIAYGDSISEAIHNAFKSDEDDGEVNDNG